MATFSLPRGRKIEISATVNASLPQQVEIIAPDVNLKWSGSGEGARIGQDVIELPTFGDDVQVQVNLTHSPEEGTWRPSHEQILDESEKGEVRVIAEDGRGTLDGNDLIVRFRWVV